MDWERIFGLANGYALIWWILLAIMPARRDIGPAVLFGGVGLLALTYAGLLIGLLTGALSDGGGGGDVDFMTLAGVRAIFSTDAGTTVGWIHYLAFDLFVGLWIVRNAEANGVARWIRLPILVLTLLAGPVGLLCYLLLRPVLTKGDARMAVPH